MSLKNWLSVDKAKQLLRRCIYAFLLVFMFVVMAMSLSTSIFSSIPVHFSDDLWDWKRNLDREVLSIWRLSTLPHDRAVRVMTLAIRHTISVYINFFQAVVITIVLTTCINSWMKQLYIAAPVWMTDITDNLLTDMGRSFSADDGECPDLLVDHNLSHSLSMSDSHDGWGGPMTTDYAPASRHASFSDEDVRRFQMLSKSLLNGQNWKNESLGSLLEHRNNGGIYKDTRGSDLGDSGVWSPPEGFVFDDEFGMIPESVETGGKKRVQQMKEKGRR